jgi:predicted DNA-binding transcriptional regulator AlpA
VASTRGETLTKDEVCRRLGVDGPQLDDLIRRGRFPRGVKLAHKSRPVWPVNVFEAALLLLPLMGGDRSAEESEGDQEKS